MIAGGDLMKESEEGRPLMDDSSLYSILNALNEGIHIVDKKGRTVFFNDMAARIDGLKKEEVLGKNIFEVYPSLTLESSTLMQVLKTGKAIRNMQQTFINFRGEKITTINTTVPIRFASDEVGAMEISQDITRFKELVETLNRFRHQLNSNLTDGHTEQHRESNDSFNRIIGDSNQMMTALEQARKAALTTSPVLISGEAGTGKELFARSIHNNSSRQEKPFVVQDCGALPLELLGSTLFGAGGRSGLFEQARGGTILLERVDSLDFPLQARVLGVLQDRKLRRVGGSQEVSIDVRIIATINSAAEQAMEEGKLRQDLFYRLSVVYIKIPALRQRLEDLPALIEYFIEGYNKMFDRSVRGFEEDLLEIFSAYEWPGNVRELQHALESAVNSVDNDSYIGFKDLPEYLQEKFKSKESSYHERLDVNSLLKKGDSLPHVIEEMEKEMVADALDKSEGNISQAAKILGISRQSLQYKMKKFKLWEGRG